ncbi:MAG: 30S ribosomal protein S2 [Anaerolineae bacterium]|jgi:small subunit ribosomal protein S2
MADISMRALLETGVHFGHRTRRWHPKMDQYIFTERKGVHVIDLRQTLAALDEACELIADTVAAGGSVLFVGTKRQAQATIAREAERCGMPHVNLRWLGGTLTNWQTIRQRIDYLHSLEARRERGDFDLLTKKEALEREREIDKLNQRFGGIKEMRELPKLLFVVDVQREATAVAEADKLGIPIIAMVDTNCNPDPIDYVIPANDDAIRAIRLIAHEIANAVAEGIARRKAYEVEEEMPEVEDLELEDEKYLSAATLARLKELSSRDRGETEETEAEETSGQETEDTEPSEESDE